MRFRRKTLIDRYILVAREILIRVARPYVHAFAGTREFGFYLMKNSETVFERENANLHLSFLISRNRKEGV
jgi:hypothetical protein